MKLININSSGLQLSFVIYSYYTTLPLPTFKRSTIVWSSDFCWNKDLKLDHLIVIHVTPTFFMDTLFFIFQDLSVHTFEVISALQAPTRIFTSSSLVRRCRLKNFSIEYPPHREWWGDGICPAVAEKNEDFFFAWTHDGRYILLALWTSISSLLTS
jgi:hypothetical protein